MRIEKWELTRRRGRWRKGGEKFLPLMHVCMCARKQGREREHGVRKNKGGREENVIEK